MAGTKNSLPAKLEGWNAADDGDTYIGTPNDIWAEGLREDHAEALVHRYNSHAPLVEALRETTDLLASAIVDSDPCLLDSTEIDPASDDGARITANRSLLAQVEAQP